MSYSQTSNHIPHKSDNRTIHSETSTFILDHKLGSGSQGAVYRAVGYSSDCAHNSLSGTPSPLASDAQAQKATSTYIRAIKVVRRPSAPVARRLQLNETRLHLCASSHPSVVTLHEVVSKGDETYLIMDYIPTGDLSMLIIDGTFKGDEELVRDTFYQVLQAVEYLHSMQIYHRDLKPENILVRLDTDTTPRVLLCDFGLATDCHLTEDFRIGCRQFMSPECFRRYPDFPVLAAAPCDVWALGVIFLTLVGSKYPWDEATDESQSFTRYLKGPEAYLLWEYDLKPETNNLLRTVFDPSPAIRIPVTTFRASFNSLNHLTIESEVERVNLRWELHLAQTAKKQTLILSEADIIMGSSLLLVQDDQSTSLLWMSPIPSPKESRSDSPWPPDQPYTSGSADGEFSASRAQRSEPNGDYFSCSELANSLPRRSKNLPQAFNRPYLLQDPRAITFEPTTSFCPTSSYSSSWASSSRDSESLTLSTTTSAASSRASYDWDLQDELCDFDELEGKALWDQVADDGPSPLGTKLYSSGSLPSYTRDMDRPFRALGALVQSWPDHDHDPRGKHHHRRPVIPALFGPSPKKSPFSTRPLPLPFIKPTASSAHPSCTFATQNSPPHPKSRALYPPRISTTPPSPTLNTDSAQDCRFPTRPSSRVRFAEQPQQLGPQQRYRRDFLHPMGVLWDGDSLTDSGDESSSSVDYRVGAAKLRRRTKRQELPRKPPRYAPPREHAFGFLIPDPRALRPNQIG